MGPDSNKSGFRRLIAGRTQELALVAIIVVVSILVQLRTGGSFLTPSNLNEMMREASMLIIVSVGMMMVIVTGGIDLSVGSVMGLAGMIAALTLRDNRSLPVIAVFGVALLVGLVCGIISGFVVAKLRIFPLIGTLGTCDVFRGVIYLFSNGEWVGQGDMTEGFLSLATGKLLGVNYMIWFALIIAAVVGLIMGWTRLGRRFYAVGNSEESARVSGINTIRTKWIAYIFSGLLASVAGVLWVSKYANAQGTSATSYELNVIASVILGGTSISGGSGNVLGVVLGALLFGILNNILPLIQVSSFWQRAIRGAVILIAVIINSLVARRAARKSMERREEHDEAAA